MRVALYRHYDAQGALLYVGVTNDPGVRTTAHERSAFWARVANMTVEWHETREAALAAERAAIRDERPAFNRTHAIRDYGLAEQIDAEQAVAAFVTSLRAFLARRGIPQRAFAVASGVSTSFLSEIVAGKKAPSLAVALQIAAVSGGEVKIDQAHNITVEAAE